MSDATDRMLEAAIGPIRVQIDPRPVTAIAQVAEPDLTFATFRIWPESHPEEARIVQCCGMFEADQMAEDAWPDGDPWCWEAVETVAGVTHV